MEKFKVFHISDVHIGMKFQRYPESVREKLIEARFDAVQKSVEIANERGCHALAIAGDLFESIKVNQRDVVKTVELLNRFEGEYVWLLPGNHDYYDPTLKIWQWLMEKASDKLVLLNESKVYEFKHDDMKVHVFAAPCDRKHSSENNLQWIKEMTHPVEGIKLLLGHGAIKEISPDLNNNYFPMTLPELRGLNMTACLLGHTHVPYPQFEHINSERVFNAGTPEPDGLNYRYDGSGWFLEIDSAGYVQAEKIKIGRFLYRDLRIELEDEIDIDKIKSYFEGESHLNTIARINIYGFVGQEAFDSRFETYDQLKAHFFFLEILDHDLKPRFSRTVIEKTFSENSIPYLVLEQLLEKYDDETAHLAFDMMMEGMNK